MDLKNLMSHAVQLVNPTTTGELPATEFQLSAQDELVQLSEEELGKINGGLDLGASAQIGSQSQEGADEQLQKGFALNTQYFNLADGFQYQKGGGKQSQGGVQFIGEGGGASLSGSAQV